MKKIIKLFFCTFMILSISGCKENKTIYEASEDIMCTYTYTISKGETIQCEIPYFEDAQNYSTFKNQLTWKLDDLMVETNDFNKSLIFQGDMPFLTITCQDSFEGTIYVDHILNKDSDNVYVSIPVNMTFTYNSKNIYEPSFAPSYYLDDEGNLSYCNQLTFARRDGFFSDYCIANKAWFVFTPKFNNLKNATIEINDLSFVNNECNKIDSIKYCIFSDVDNDFATCQGISYPYSEYPIVLKDKEYNVQECLVIEFNFSDIIENSSYLTGGTIKFNVKINGDDYEIYRNLYYFRMIWDFGE